MISNQKNILITQSNYIPWKGYFDAIALCDVFVVYDDMQFTKRDWRNRNMIKATSKLVAMNNTLNIKTLLSAVMIAVCVRSSIR